MFTLIVLGLTGACVGSIGGALFGGADGWLSGAAGGLLAGVALWMALSVAAQIRRERRLNRYFVQARDRGSRDER